MPFFEAQSLGKDEAPDLDVVDLDPAPAEFGDQTAQGAVTPARSSSQSRSSPAGSGGL
jgi:hypothetical protein